MSRIGRGIYKREVHKEICIGRKFERHREE